MGARGWRGRRTAGRHRLQADLHPADPLACPGKGGVQPVAFLRVAGVVIFGGQAHREDEGIAPIIVRQAFLVVHRRQQGIPGQNVSNLDREQVRAALL